MSSTKIKVDMLISRSLMWMNGCNHKLYIQFGSAIGLFLLFVGIKVLDGVTLNDGVWSKTIDSKAPLDGLTCLQVFHPSLDVSVLLELQVFLGIVVNVETAYPRVDGHVSNCVFVATDILLAIEVLLQDVNE